MRRWPGRGGALTAPPARQGPAPRPPPPPRAASAPRDTLAAACLAAGRHEEAIAGYQRALADRGHAHGADRTGTIAARRNLAAAYHAAGKIAAALQLHEQACAEYEQALGPAHL